MGLASLGIACADDGSPANSDPTDTHDTVNERAQETVFDFFRACGLVTEGHDWALLTTGAATYFSARSEYAECEAKCLTGQTCDQARELVCGSGPASGYEQCRSDCIPKCPDGETPLPWYYRCDGVPNCPDMSDEDDCEQFTCEDGSRTLQTNVCNTVDDCSDSSDEKGCPPRQMVECDDGDTVPGKRCNGAEDCLDGSDEDGCGGTIDCD